MGKQSLPKITERQFQEQFRKGAILTGWRVYHTWNSMHSSAGFPDNVLIHEKKHRLMVAELKSETGKLSEAQIEWLEAFRKIPGVEVHVFRPDDFGGVWEILKGP